MSEQVIMSQMADNTRRINELERWMEQAHKDGRVAQERAYLSEQNDLLQANELLANQLAEVL